jgi:hypothetical protein
MTPTPCIRPTSQVLRVRVDEGEDEADGEDGRHHDGDACNRLHVGDVIEVQRPEGEGEVGDEAAGHGAEAAGQFGLQDAAITSS